MKYFYLFIISNTRSQCKLDTQCSTKNEILLQPDINPMRARELKKVEWC